MSDTQGQSNVCRSKGAGLRRVRMTRETGQSLVLSGLCCCQEDGERAQVEVRISQVCVGGTAILEVVLPDGVFVERKETLEGVRALFSRPLNLRPAEG